MGQKEILEENVDMEGGEQQAQSAVADNRDDKIAVMNNQIDS